MSLLIRSWNASWKSCSKILCRLISQNIVRGHLQMWGVLDMENWRQISGELVLSLIYPFQLCNFCNKLFQSIVHLAITMCWATSYKTSKHHSGKFEKNMVACNVCWTSTLIFSFAQITILPSTLDPSSHNSDQHMVGECFLFKRVIGILQWINTNSKLGKQWKQTGYKEITYEIA